MFTGEVKSNATMNSFHIFNSERDFKISESDSKILKCIPVVQFVKTIEFLFAGINIF